MPESGAEPFDILVVSYGAPDSPARLVASLRAQTAKPGTIWIWHNGPGFDEEALAMFERLGGGIEVRLSGENLGYGGALNRLFALSRARRLIIVNPDVELEANCLAEFAAAFARHPGATIVGGLLLSGLPGAAGTRVNAYGQRLTLDLVGVNTDRGKPWPDFEAQAAAESADAGSRYLGPSGALFAVDRANWEHACTGPLFCESLFLYLEDVALWLKVRRAGGEIRFWPKARGFHRMSESTGLRSALKLYHVERNRLWLLRALWGRAGALAVAPFSLLRLSGYVASALRAHPEQGAHAGDSFALAQALCRAWKAGFFGQMPEALQARASSEGCAYLGPERAPSDLWSFVAPLGAQLRDPTRSSFSPLKGKRRG